MKRILIINTCYQCQYGAEETESMQNFCHQVGRKIEDMNKIPDWCSLEKYDDLEKDDDLH